MRVIVVGGGIIGCATALALVDRGANEVIVIDRSFAGAEASRAAAGMLAAQVESNTEAELATYCAARDAYPAWIGQLHERSGVQSTHKKNGALCLARTHEAHETLLARVRTQRNLGFNAEYIEPRHIHAIEPEVATTNLLGAAYFPDEAQVDPPHVMRALVVAASRAAVTFRSHCQVTELLVRSGRCVGARVAAEGSTAAHDELADAVVLAAGSWSALIANVPHELRDVRPIRGHIVELTQLPPRLATMVFENHCYITPRGEGRVICGSTMEDVGHDRTVTAAAVTQVRHAAITMAPGLRDAPLTNAWCNFRPMRRSAQSNEPLIGASSMPGLYTATGHHRNGILLAQATASAVADAIVNSR